MPAMSAGDIDCQKCGACCLASAWSPSAALRPFADVQDNEVKRIERRLPLSVVPVQPFGFAFQTVTNAMAINRRDRRGRCVALKGTVGRKVSCSIYSVRPEGCVDFEPGSERCLEIRRMVLGINSAQAVS